MIELITVNQIDVVRLNSSLQNDNHYCIIIFLTIIEHVPCRSLVYGSVSVIPGFYMTYRCIIFSRVQGDVSSDTIINHGYSNGHDHYNEEGTRVFRTDRTSTGYSFDFNHSEKEWTSLLCEIGYQELESTGNFERPL